MNRWPKRLVFLALFAVPVAISLGWSWLTAGAYSVDPADPPSRIFYCGRDYLPGAHVTKKEATSIPNQFGSVQFRQVGKTLRGRPIYAQPLPDDVRNRVEPALPCDMGVYLKVGSDDYIAYVISGGP